MRWANLLLAFLYVNVLKSCTNYMAIAKGETQIVKLDAVSTELMRVAKSRAALRGCSLQNYVTDLLEEAIREKLLKADVEPA